MNGEEAGVREEKERREDELMAGVEGRGGG